MRPFVLAPLVVVTTALSGLAPTATAQSPAPMASRTAPAAESREATRSEPGTAPAAAGPRRAAGRAGIAPTVRTDRPSAGPIPVMQESRRRNGQLLTIVGGAIFVVGMLMDDDDVGTVVALGGLAVGVYGLIQWLQASVTGVTSGASVTNVSSP